MPKYIASVRLFGTYEIVSRTAKEVRLPTDRSRLLLAMLLINSGLAITRDRLINSLWDEGSDARLRRNLNTELWRIRQALEEAGENPQDWWSSSGDALVFRPNSNINVDVNHFDAVWQRSIIQNEAIDINEIEAAAALYRGEFAPGFYTDWCLVAREMYESRYLACLEKALEHYKKEAHWANVVRVARVILAKDAFLENVHRDLMRAYTAMGNRAAAVLHYRTLRQHLEKELGVGPARETRALYVALEESEPYKPGTVRKDLSIVSAPPADQRLVAVRRQLLELSRELGTIVRKHR